MRVNRMARKVVRPGACLALVSLLGVASAHGGQASSSAERAIVANDNRRAAGTSANGSLTLQLVAEQGTWQPEGPNGRTLSMQAFREETGTLSIPGPLLRVPTGTQVRVAIRNAIPGATLRVFGLREPQTTADAGLEVAPGQTRETMFRAESPGTYHYWATTTGRPLAQRGDVDSQLGGAIVIDPPGPRADDRVMVVGVWRKPDTPPGTFIDVGTINGRSWPLTDVLDYKVGDTVRWRVVNLSLDNHAMHLHGQHFTVLGTGDGATFRPYSEADQWSAVTQQTAPGATFDMQWSPERPGNWLFHCHMTAHMTPPSDQAAHAHQPADEAAGMAGLVVGIRVAGSSAPAVAAVPPRRFTLHLREESGRYGNRPGYRVDAEGIETWRVSSGPLPGPTLVLQRGEPVEVTLANHMKDSTAIHWHGIELDSYFDGVPGWGGMPGSITPLIMPGQAFAARFTPPRAGTFIYHTHAHDDTQLSGGLYGALIVLAPGERYDPATDHVFIAGYDGPGDTGQREPIVINGAAATVPAAVPGPRPHALRAGVENRIRLINITPNNVALTFVLTDGVRVLAWKPLAKDGADLQPAQQAVRDARQLVSVGETYDFAVTPTPGQRLWLNLLRGSGEWVAQTLLVAGP
jgi:FtsP/CotA-like multicopper oxidase with cupredoxin domain